MKRQSWKNQNEKISHSHCFCFPPNAKAKLGGGGCIPASLRRSLLPPGQKRRQGTGWQGLRRKKDRANSPGRRDPTSGGGIPEDCTGQAGSRHSEGSRAAAAGTRGWWCGNGDGPAGAGTAKGRQGRRRGRLAAPAAPDRAGRRREPSILAPTGLLGRGGEGITRLGEER